MQNPLWDYVTAVYGAQGVAPACLYLQDRFGFDVNLLLYAAWLARSHRRLVPAHVHALDAAVGDWRNQVIGPLRTLRTQLRAQAGAGDMYDAVKALELRAEREQVDKMYALFRSADALPVAHQPLRENLAVVAGFTRPAEQGWASAIDDLAALIAD